jgi:hypothetical protein
MNKHKNRMPIVAGVLFALAAVLLLGSTIGGTRAALTYYSENYNSQIEMNHIGVTLNENGSVISQRDYTGNGSWTGGTTGELLAGIEEGDGIVLGKAYPEALTVTNSGDIDTYVRVTITKYWLDKDGTTKLQTLTPDLIDLHFLEGSGWVIDEAASTAERTVLYYTEMLAAGESTSALSDQIKIDSSVASTVSQSTTTNGGYTTVTTTYVYDGVSFVIEAEADAVQAHNAEDAILSAWGRNVSISGTTLSLK